MIGSWQSTVVQIVSNDLLNTRGGSWWLMTMMVTTQIWNQLEQVSRSGPQWHGVEAGWSESHLGARDLSESSWASTPLSQWSQGFAADWKFQMAIPSRRKQAILDLYTSLYCHHWPLLHIIASRFDLSLTVSFSILAIVAYGPLLSKHDSRINHHYSWVVTIILKKSSINNHHCWPVSTINHSQFFVHIIIHD